jgi:hypothetical protein
MRIGLLWRREWDPAVTAPESKLHGVFAAFAAEGVSAEPVVYSDETAAAVAEQLRELDGVLVWVNPIEQGKDRSRLDAVLRETPAWVSAHPDVIAKLATKRVLVDTQSVGWSPDARIYATADELPEGTTVLKQLYGMGGIGVWKVEVGRDDLLVQAASGNRPPERTTRAAFAARATWPLVGQPYQRRLPEGMIRAYLTHDRVVGFTHQYPRGLMPPAVDDRPATKLFEPPDAPRFQSLRRLLEDEWVPRMQDVLGLATDALPVIWDADFLFGDGDDEYVLCEINASSTFAFPEFAMPGVARATLAAVRTGNRRPL